MDDQHSLNEREASEAWQQMQALLDADMPVNKGNKNNNRRYSVLLLILLTGSCGVYKWLNNNDTSVIAKHNAVVKKVENRNAVSRNYLKNKQVIKQAITGIEKPLAVNENENLSTAQTKQPLNLSPIQTSKKPIAKKTERPIKNILTTIDDRKNILTNKRTQNEIINDDVYAGTIKKTSAESIGKNSFPENKNPDSMSFNSDVSNSKLLADSQALAKLEVKSESKIITGKDSTRVAKKSKLNTVKSNRNIHFGLEWSTPLPFNNNTTFIEVNAKKQPLTILIPSVWVSRDISKKSTLLFSINPYAQYLLNNSATLQSGDYQISAVSASNINQLAQTVNIAQTHVLYKVIGVETALQYRYKLSEKWSVGFAIANTFTNTALLKEKLVKNKMNVLKDSLYGVVKTDRDWRYIRHNFLTGKVMIAYQLKRFQLGASIFKPITPVYNSTLTKESPMNMQLFLRWMWK